MFCFVFGCLGFLFLFFLSGDFVCFVLAVCEERGGGEGGGEEGEGVEEERATSLKTRKSSFSLRWVVESEPELIYVQ